MCWFTPATLALQKQRQEDGRKFKVKPELHKEFQGSLGTEGDPVWEEGWGHIFKSLTVGF